MADVFILVFRLTITRDEGVPPEGDWLRIHIPRCFFTMEARRHRRAGHFTSNISLICPSQLSHFIPTLRRIHFVEPLNRNSTRAVE